MATIQQLLRRRREALGLSLDEASVLLGGVDISTISRFERGFRDSLSKGKTADDYRTALEQYAATKQAAS